MKLDFKNTIRLDEVTPEVLLDYYIVENNEENFGLKIEKKEKKAGKFVVCEEYTSDYIIDDFEEASKVLNTFIQNTVTPTTAESILEDMGYFNAKYWYLKFKYDTIILGDG